MNKQQISYAKEIAATTQRVEEQHLALMICSATGASYENVIAWVRAATK